MKTVWKYELWLDVKNDVRLPVGAKPLYVDFQGAKLCLWVMVDEDAPEDADYRHFYIRGTGRPIEDGAEYIGSAQLLIDGPSDWRESPLVVHVFESSS